jgi:hypothetical protein
MAARDEFSAKVKRILGSRVCYRCSNPQCLRATIGPASDEDESVNVGVAAHITAAAGGGPRYDARLSPEERKGASNGIWLCQGCAKLIDSDEKRFTTDVIRKWKKDAVAGAFKAIATSHGPVPATIVIRLDDADREFLQSLGLPAADADVDAVIVRMRAAAGDDVAVFRNTREWPSHTIGLSLTLNDAHGSSAVSLPGIAAAIGVPDGLSIVSDPGTGKTTTLVQLADRILAAGSFVPVVVPLGEWSDREDDFFDFAKRRYAYRSFRREHFMQAAYHGRLVLLLDGWNELDATSQARAIRDLKALRRDYPVLNIIVGTRRHAAPVAGAVVEIEPLSHDQQRELAKTLRGSEGEALVDQAWRTPGIRDLMGIPLYLHALVMTTPSASFPQTKEEVLRMFVTQHEGAAEQAAILRRELFGFHTNMLIGLAIEANRTGNTAISDTSARRVISEVETGLVQTGQMTIQPQPASVIDVLTSSHVLVRSTSAGSAISFQHQLFQEWYASFEVERLMLDAAQGDAAARLKFRNDILNWIAWEESVLFACERLSRKGPEGVRAVSAAVREAVGIDPVLAAEMIFRAAEEVWAEVGSETIALAQRWHRPGKVDRAVRFMITTGKPEFAELIWPLISNGDNQIHIDAMRAAERFRPAVLGKDAETRLATLPDDIRKDVLGEIASNSGLEGMELTARLAKTDRSPDVVVDIIQSLQFRRGDRHVAEILKDASDQVWQHLAQQGYPDKLADPGQDARLAALRMEEQAGRQADPERRFGYLLEHGQANAETGEQLAALIRSQEFPINIDQGRWSVQRAFQRYPEPVANAMVARIAAGLELPYGAKEYLARVDTIDNGPVAASAIDPATPEHMAMAAASVIGPRTVGTLIDRFIALNATLRTRQPSEEERKEYHRLMDAIRASRQASFIEAFIARAGSNEPIVIDRLADLFARHGRDDGERDRNLSQSDRDRLSPIVGQWIDTLLTSPTANRHQMSNVARVVERLGGPHLADGLRRMLARDLADWARAREKHFKAGRRGGPLTPDVTYSHMLEYRRAFEAIGGEAVMGMMRSYLADARFGNDAAWVLANSWRRAHPTGKEPRFPSRVDFSEVKARREQRRGGASPLATCDEAEAIFSVVRELGKQDKDGATQRHAIGLAYVALGIPHGSKRQEIDQLLALLQPYAAKQGLFRAAATAGEELPAGSLLAAVRELLEAAKTESWRLSENRGELMGWIELFPFSDRPLSVIEALDLMPAEHRQPWQLDHLLSALEHGPSDACLETLGALAELDPRIAERHEWYNAIVRIGTLPAARKLLDLICSGSPVGRAGGVDTWHLGRRFAEFAGKFPAFRAELMERYPTLGAGAAKAIVERALVEISDADVVMAMVRSHAADARPFDGALGEAIRNVAVGRRPAVGWPGAFEEFSVPLTALRKQLFDLVAAGNKESSLAEACLIKIDRLRDRHGGIEGEPRHPDIDSGRSWPKEANQN